MKPNFISGTRWLRSIAAGFLLLVHGSSAEEDFVINWFAIEGGGGENSGGDYSLIGSVSQPEAGAAMAGGDFSVEAGFLSVIEVEGPPLRIAHSGDGTITAAWPSSFTTHPLPT